ncbi:MAG TPA: protein kinase [Candidatus Saccharimonadales bacterium]|nr:protein kinase [Candidatus Saccharimonadales bacterium]
MPVSPGQMVAHYRLVQKLGEGGMGVVWRARDTRLDRDVALKMLPPGQVGDASRRARFIREAKAAAAVSHPNIAAIHDVGETDGAVYLAMELVEGRTLRTLVSEGQLAPARIAAIGAQIAEGLGRAHREGIVHRDIKPDNVIVDGSGHVKILDFGLAKLRGSREEERAADLAEKETLAALTQEGQTVGTVPYMSPEQARGKATDGRSDVFSLGIVLYELATGRLPFRGRTSLDTLSAIINEAPPPPSSLNPAVSDRLSELLGKCLEKDPARRYQSAGDLAVDLRRLAGVPESTFQRAAETDPAIRRGTMRAIAAVAIVAALSVAAAWWLGRRGERLPQEASQASANGAAESASAIRSLAVLPLDDHSPGHDEQYFADGMTEALIAEIAQISDLRVISRTSVMQYRERHPPLPEIARELGVDAVVEGSVLRADGRIRIIAQLIEASDDRHLWAGTYERDHKNVLTLQREVAVAIAGEIQGALRPGAAQLGSPAGTVDPEAHVLYMRGEESLSTGTEESLRRSLVQFHSALEIDPAYAMAWLGIARSYAGLANTYVAPRKAMPQAKKAVLRALAIDPGLAEAYAQLGQIQILFEWNPEASDLSMKRAQEINPNFPGALMQEAYAELSRGNRQRAFEVIRKVRSLDPLSPGTTEGAYYFHFYARDYEGALALAESLTSRFPSNAQYHQNKAMALELLDRKEESLAETERAVELDESIWSLAALARAQALAGQATAARRTLARMKTAPADRYQCPFETALSWTALGEYDRARELFGQGIEERAICWIGADDDPRIDDIRKLPWFQDLLKRRTPMGPDDPDYVPLM